MAYRNEKRVTLALLSCVMKRPSGPLRINDSASAPGWCGPTVTVGHFWIFPAAEKRVARIGTKQSFAWFGQRIIAGSIMGEHEWIVYWPGRWLL